jgi:hypothetical protein
MRRPLVWRAAFLKALRRAPNLPWSDFVSLHFAVIPPSGCRPPEAFALGCRHAKQFYHSARLFQDVGSEALG